MSSKKDFYIVNKLICEFINNLSDSDYESLVNGTATVKIKRKEIPDTTKEVYAVILKKLATVDKDKLLYEIEQIDELKNKAGKINFCEYVNVTLLKKDTNDEIKYKIAEYIINNKEDILYKLEKKSFMTNSLEKIAATLENYMDEKEAKDFLMHSELLTNKTNLFKLANLLDVYVLKEKTNEEIIDLIVSAVVGARIRSYKIRNKEINS